MSTAESATPRTSPDGSTTRERLLDAAWELMRSRGLDVPMKDVAAAVGISRQALYLHFPSRAALLRGMTLHHDARSGTRQRFSAALAAPTAEGALDATLRVWFAYVPDILPVARALEAAATTDTEAAEAWWEALNRGYTFARRVVTRLEEDGRLDPTWEAEEAAQMLWSLNHPRTWDNLVVHQGWDPDHFIDRQVEVARRVLLA